MTRRKRSSDEAKLRTREHIVADLAVNYCERQALLCGFAVGRTSVDYGIDLRLFTFTDRGELEAGTLQIQVKGSDNVRFGRERTVVRWRIDRSDLVTWLDELLPVILVVYDAGADVAYWLHIQDYFHNLAGFNPFARVGTVTAYIPTGQILNPEAVRGFAILRDQASTR